MKGPPTENALVRIVARDPSSNAGADTTDGVFMSRAYGWAFTSPVRKIYYNLTTTALSVQADWMGASKVEFPKGSGIFIQVESATNYIKFTPAASELTNTSRAAKSMLVRSRESTSEMRMAPSSATIPVPTFAAIM